MKRYRSPRHPMVATVPNVTATIGARTVGATSPSSQNRQRDPGLLLRANRDSEHGLAPPLPATPGQRTGARSRSRVTVRAAQAEGPTLTARRHAPPSCPRRGREGRNVVHAAKSSQVVQRSGTTAPPDQPTGVSDQKKSPANRGLSKRVSEGTRTPDRLDHNQIEWVGLTHLFWDLQGLLALSSSQFCSR